MYEEPSSSMPALLTTKVAKMRRTSFQTLNKKAFPKKGEAKIVLPNKKESSLSEEAASFLESMNPQDEADSRAFLNATSGTKPLHQKKGEKKTPSKLVFTPLAKPKTVALHIVDKNEAEENDADLQVFLSAVQDVKRLPGKGRDVQPEVLPVAPPPPTEEEAKEDPLQDFMDGKLQFALACTDEYVEGHILGLDLLTVGKLQAGQYSPESHLDLHGLNTVQAFDALVGFIKGAYFKGHRTLLIVTGRGKNSPQGVPILRSKLQSWLTQDPFRRVVLAFCTARQADGGAGALYILLRKRRKDQGKVYWDRKPVDPDLI